MCKTLSLVLRLIQDKPILSAHFWNRRSFQLIFVEIYCNQICLEPHTYFKSSFSPWPRWESSMLHYYFSSILFMLKSSWSFMNIPLFDSKTILSPLKGFVTPLLTDTFLDLTPTLTIHRRLQKGWNGDLKNKSGVWFSSCITRRQFLTISGAKTHTVLTELIKKHFSVIYGTEGRRRAFPWKTDGLLYDAWVCF